MAVRRGQPTLIELVRDRPRRPVQVRPMAPRVAAPPPTEPAGHRAASASVRPERPPMLAGLRDWLAGGRRLSLPTGYVMLLLAAVIVLLAGAYMLGFRQAESAARKDLAARLLAESVLVDPLASAEPEQALPNPGGAGSGAGPRQAPRQAAAEPPARPLVKQSPGPAAALQVGLNYFVVMRGNRADADRASDFLKANGVDAGVFGTKDRGLFEVIALQGYRGSDINGPEATALKTRIQTLGRAWKRDHRGADAFESMYPRKHKG